jgi:serine/threonine protein kinase
MEPTSARAVHFRSEDGKWAFEVPEGGSVTVGRDPQRAQFAVPFVALSRVHVRFRNEGGVCTVEYVGARGCIWVNNEIVPKPGSIVRPGDSVMLLGDLIFVMQPVAAGYDETNPLHPSDLARQERLEAVLAECLRRAEAGETVDRPAIQAAHPDLADDLREFFTNHARLARIVANSLRSSPATGTYARPTKVRCFGDYEILAEIARGGMGIVYKARQISLNRPVAVKMILAGQFANESEVKRFHAEAEAAANLRHPGVVPIYEVGINQGQHYFSMEYVEGRSLAQLTRENSLSAIKAAELVLETAAIVQYAHEQGVLHRDLKPSNILIGANNRVRITDFGLSKRMTGDSDLTLTGQVIGTPSYMPPEQAAAQHEIIGAASDVYALGAILYELLTGRPPFRGDTIGETLRQVQHDDPVRPRLLTPKLLRDLETICLKCLEKEPRRRYATAQELADELGRFLRGEPIHARSIGTLERTFKLVMRQPATAISLGLLGILISTLLQVIAAVPELWRFLGSGVNAAVKVLLIEIVAGCLGGIYSASVMKQPDRSRWTIWITSIVIIISGPMFLFFRFGIVLLNGK